MKRLPGEVDDAYFHKVAELVELIKSLRRDGLDKLHRAIELHKKTDRDNQVSGERETNVDL